MGDDVICIDSDEDDEDETPVAKGTIGSRAHSRARGAGGRFGGRNRWARRRAQRGRKNDFTASSNSNNNNGTPLAKLLDGLRWLSSEMYFGEWAGKSGPDFPFHMVAQRVRSLVAEFQRFAAVGLLTMPERTEGWRQVLRFLVLLRTVGLTEVSPTADDDNPGCHKHFQGNDNQQSIDVTSQSRTNHKSKQSDRSAADGREKARQTRRYQLTVIDLLADYIRFRCESVTGLHPSCIQPGTLLRECNRIVGSMYVIFDGSMELMTLTLLRLSPDRQHTPLLYPVFENVLTVNGTSRAHDTDTIPGYVRMLLCFKRWKSLVSGRDGKATIDAHAIRLLPGRCPTVQHTSDLAFLRLLPPVPPGQRMAETRFLLANDLFNVERCIAQFQRHHRRTVGGTETVRRESTTAKQRDNSSIRQRRLQSMEIRSNYINVPLLAELIERKSQLWAQDMGAQPSIEQSCYQQEAHSIIESLRLIFRKRIEFIELTLLRVKCYPAVVSLLEPVFEAFLGTTAAGEPATTSSTGLTIYRSNDVETYGRLMLCYAKWKSLYCGGEEGKEPAEWTTIDAVALTQLPYEFPRAICPRDALLRRIFPAGAGMAPADGKRNNATTRILLQTLPKRSDLQELCLKFSQAYRCGTDATFPLDETPNQEEQKVTHTPTTSSFAYKSPSSGTERSLRWHLSASNVSGQPTTFQTEQPAECRSEMKPIIIPDSDDADETSTSNTISLLPVKQLEHNITAQILLPSLRTSAETLTGTDRNSTNATPTVEFAADGATPPVTVWSPFGECFLNTPPATPQHEQPPEVVEEEQQQPVHHPHHRRNALIKKSFPNRSWLQLKGTIRLIGHRKRRTTVTGIVKRVLLKVFAHDGWWNFADIQAVKIHNPTNNIQQCFSSIMNINRGESAQENMRNTVTNGRPEILSAEEAVGSRTEDGSRRSSSKVEDRSKNDALLHELIDCLGAVDTMPFESKQGYVDFAILPDNLGHGAERSHSDGMDDQASPSSCGSGCTDMSPLFAADSDKYVLLFTEIGPVSWPIV